MATTSTTLARPISGSNTRPLCRNRLGEDAPIEALVAHCARLLHPSDSSINVAIAQGSHEQPHPLSLEFQAQTQWLWCAPILVPRRTKKTCLIDLTGIFARNSAQTSPPYKLEIYWIRFSGARPDKQSAQSNSPGSKHRGPHYRGFSMIHQANPPRRNTDYNQLAGTTQRWQDLEAITRATRRAQFTGRNDDRYVIMNAGMSYPSLHRATPPPPDGFAIM